MNLLKPLVDNQIEPVPRAGMGCLSRRIRRAGRVTNPYPAPAYRYGYGLPALVEDRKHTQWEDS